MRGGEQPVQDARSRSRVRLQLIVSLIGLAITYAALLPRLRSMSAETARLNRIAAASQAEAAHLAQVRAALQSARAGVERTPPDVEAGREPRQQPSELGQKTLQETEVAAGLRPRAPSLPGPVAPESPSVDIKKRAWLQAAIRSNPQDPYAYLRLALFDRDSNDATGAERELRLLWQTFPRFFEGPYNLGRLYLSEGRNSDAIGPLKAAANLARRNAEAQVMAGIACFRAVRYSEAREYATSAIHIDPAQPAPYLLLTRIYSNNGTPQQAMSALQAYLHRSHDPAPGYYLLGRFFYRSANRPRAEVYLKRALDSAPNNPDYLTMLGHVYCELGHGTDVAAGINCYERALAQRPHDGETHAALGRVLMREEQWEQAIRHLRIALENASDAGPICYSLGQALLHGGHPEQGRQMLAQYQAYLDYTRGVDKLKRAIRRAPNERAPRYALTRFCMSYRQYTAARETVTDVVRLFGEDHTSRQLVDEIHVRMSARTPHR